MPTPQPSITIGPVTVRFTWMGDRWSHEVSVGEGHVWRSVEGPRAADGDDRWPASPVLVELSPIETASGPAILGVGRAGRSHFSASIGADPIHPGHVRFEIACRVAEPPAWLGSTYHAAGGRVVVEPSDGPGNLPATIEWSYAFGAAGLVACDRPRNWSDS
ncbi:MAG: hypothetical protein ACKOEX_14250 [Planctomycetia bacterium]